MNIILTCGYNQSMHTIALIDLLHKQGHNIKGCLIVNTLQYKRFRNYIKKYQSTPNNERLKKDQ